MSRYRKSIHQTLQEVAEWEAPKEPEVIVEEAPIPTETGRELLKKRIAHKKIEKKELKYYPMGDVFKGKLHKTTEYLKEALEIDDELDEAIKWEVKVTNLPVFYADGRSKGKVRQMLRKLLKHPDDIISITRTTSAELKKIRRGQIAGDEPGDEDEDKNPVGPSYNEDVELDEAGRPRGAAHIENKRFWDLKDKELHYIIKDAGQAVQANPTAKKATQGPGNWSDQINDAATVLYYRKKKNIKVEKFEGPFTAPGSGSIAKPRKAKASDANKSIEQQMADARRGKLAFQEDEWDTMWKNAAKEKPKMSFKQATEFVDEVGLDKKEKKNALKTAKKWLR
jgi:hypothetical protein